jgi:hypothetical protein
MNRPRLTIRRLIVALVLIAVVGLAQAGSSAIQGDLLRQGKAEEFASTEGTFRQRASVREELSRNLREVAALAREMAGSASAEFERARWLELARSEDEKATRLDREAVRMIAQADQMASRASVHYRASWRPWAPEPE